MRIKIKNPKKIIMLNYTLLFIAAYNGHSSGHVGKKSIKAATALFIGWYFGFCCPYRTGFFHETFLNSRTF